jgi:site-specific DNA-methyltransferase (cytosine-N4-specific)
MTYELTCRIKPYIQPFERELALRELEALAGAVPRPVPRDPGQPECFRVRSQVAPVALARDLAFWEAVRGENTLTTTQSLRESTVNVVRNGISLEAIASVLPFNGSVPFPNRRCLRYGSHGLHEYRGKFFPQLVRNFINLAKVPSKGVVADPFSGSGTTAVEAILAERTVVGLDINPLSVFMAKTKCALLRVKVSDLEDAYVKVRSLLLAGAQPTGCSRLREIAPSDAEYLAAWFHPRILEELDFIYASICSTPTGGIRELFLLALSNILRKVSWQREDDLRVRREIKLIDEIDPIREFLQEIGRSVRLVLAFLRQEPNRRLGKARIEEGDARHLQTHWRSLRGKVDAVITSPPYATALPYLDTDRLSLCFLGLLPRNEHRKRDQAMIGNREITERARTHYWNEFTRAKDILPASVTSLISRIQSLNQRGNVGFRRRNLASLLYKYFSDMRQVFVGVSEVLRDGASVFVVVGNNHTMAGGKHIEIPTADLLAEIVDSVGLQTVQRIPMEMLVSRDIFRKNAIGSESILHFKKL